MTQQTKLKMLVICGLLSIIAGVPHAPLKADEPFKTLADFESAALDNNPTMRAAFASVEAARHQAVQASLKTNPSLGLFGEEIGNDENSLFGVFLSRKFRRGGKRVIDSEVKSREAAVLEQQFQQQKFRIETDVRTAFYNLLIAQRQLELSNQLNETQQQAANQIKKLFEAEESPKTDLFQAEIKAQQTAIQVRQNELNLTSAWRELVALVGLPDLPVNDVEGSLDDLPAPLEWEEALSNVLSCSPEIHTAQAAIEQADAAYRQALAGAVPDVQAQISAGYDTSTNDPFGGFQVSMPMQIYNRNQGNIAAAQAGIRRAHEELRRIELSLQKRLAVEFRDYQQASEQTRIYAESLLPKGKQTLDLATAGYREGETSFLQLLSVQQTTIDLTSQYLRSLQQLWRSYQRISGLLLNNSLDNN